MDIIYDTDNCDRRIYWAMFMEEEVVKIEGRVITIINKGEIISPYFPEWVTTKTGETERVFIDRELVYKDGRPAYQHKESKFENIKVSD